MKKNPWNLNWLNEKKSKKLGHVAGVTYRHAAGYRRLENGQLVCVADKMRDIPGGKRKKLRAQIRQEKQLLEIEKGME